MRNFCYFTAGGKEISMQDAAMQNGIFGCICQDKGVWYANTGSIQRKPVVTVKQSQYAMLRITHTNGFQLTKRKYPRFVVSECIGVYENAQKAKLAVIKHLSV